MMTDSHPTIQSRSKSRQMVMKHEEKRNTDKEKIVKSAKEKKKTVSVQSEDSEADN